MYVTIAYFSLDRFFFLTSFTDSLSNVRKVIFFSTSRVDGFDPKVDAVVQFWCNDHIPNFNAKYVFRLRFIILLPTLKYWLTIPK